MYIDFPYSPYDYESITVGTTPVGLTTSKCSPEGQPSGRAAFLTLEGAEARYRLDGGNPSATEGHLWGIGTVPLAIFGADTLRSFRVVQAGASPATMQVSYAR